jgi:hypothetical protein
VADNESQRKAERLSCFGSNALEKGYMIELGEISFLGLSRVCVAGSVIYEMEVRKKNT